MNNMKVIAVTSVFFLVSTTIYAQDTLNFEMLNFNNGKKSILQYSVYISKNDSSYEVQYSDTLLYKAEELDKIITNDSTNLHLNKEFQIANRLYRDTGKHSDQQYLNVAYIKTELGFFRHERRILVNLLFNNRPQIVRLTFSSQFDKSLIPYYISLQHFLLSTEESWEYFDSIENSELVRKSFFF